jgi:hypothetical protein
MYSESSAEPFGATDAAENSCRLTRRPWLAWEVLKKGGEGRNEHGTVENREPG